MKGRSTSGSRVVTTTAGLVPATERIAPHTSKAALSVFG